MVGEEEEPDWMTPYKNFLTQGVLPSHDNEVRCLKWKANYYIILDGELLKRGLIASLLKCLNNQQTDYVIRELHEGICALYIGGRSLATKVTLLTLQRDVDDARSLQTFRAPLLTISIV
ncbi:hypothetical protein GYH30_039596 [Glycine max]|uniref:Uncharacterized protein n=1 Tax=Glycine max TaxID=3847 RepID=A0A0R0GBJ6_SOYBN|nr:hypothetical protein GYH30_039596 [Glycine max]